MYSKFLLAALFAGGAFAAGLLEAPYRGCILDGSGVRFVHGLRGSFAATESTLDGALSAACSDRYTVVKTQASMLVLDRGGNVVSSEQTPGGPALIAFNDRDEPAFAYLPEAREFRRWASERWSTIETPVNGDVLAIAAAGDTLVILRRRDERLWLTRTRDGAITADEPIHGSATAAMILPDGSVLLASGATLRLRTPEGVEREFEMPSAIRSMTLMSAGWIAVETESMRLAVERTADGLRHYLLSGGRFLTVAVLSRPEGVQ